MIFSKFLTTDMQMSKFGRLRMNYDLYEKVIQAKELANGYIKKTNELKVKTVIGYDQRS
jgi:hypothetical protein